MNFGPRLFFKGGLWLLPGLLALPVWPQQPLGSPVAPDALTRQREAAASMRDSLDRQREAVRKQVGQSSSFFTQPRAGSLGPVSGTPLPAEAWASAQAPAPTPIASPPSAWIAPGCDPLPAPAVDSLVEDTARREGLDAALLRGVMKQESGFRPCAVSNKGAMGLMQLMPGTAQDLGIDDPFDAASNADAGARFLKQLLGRYGGDVGKALGAYNAGPARVDAAGAVPAIPETMDYVRQILSTLPVQ